MLALDLRCVAAPPYRGCRVDRARRRLTHGRLRPTAYRRGSLVLRRARRRPHGALLPRRERRAGAAGPHPHSSPRPHAPAADPACTQGGGAHVVLLDGRTLRTPARNPLSLPSLPLALAVAAEWEWQEQRNLRPFTMPIMVRGRKHTGFRHLRISEPQSSCAHESRLHRVQSLCSTAIDRMPSTRAQTIDSLVNFFGTDALCVRAETPALAEAQAAEWDPLLDWAGQELGARPAASSSLLGPPHSPEVLAAMRAALHACDDWELAGVSALSAASRSLVMSFALQRRRVRPADAPRLLRLEEDRQTAEWGFVEGGHDVDIADLKARIAAPVLFLDLYAAATRARV